MTEEEKDIAMWYVVGTTSVHHETNIRDNLKRAGFRSYVPMAYEVKTVRRQEQRIMVPAITGLIFARGSYNGLKAYFDTTRERLYLRRSTFTNKEEYLVVKDGLMEEFIRFTNSRQEHITYFSPDELDIKKGEKVRVKGGIYDGYEGIIKHIKGKKRKHLVIQIPGVVIAAIEIDASLVEVSEKEMPRNERLDKRTKNMEKDKKLLYDTAFYLLFSPTDDDNRDMEYNLRLCELKRVRERLERYKGFSASAEGELSLAMYMANVKLGIDLEKSTERLTNAIDKLQSTSLLRLKMQLILARLSKDQELEETVMSEVNSWNQRLLSRKQQEFMDEARKMGL